MLQHTASPLRSSALALTIGLVLLGAVPYQVTARAPVAPTPAVAPTATIAPVAVATATATPQAHPAVAPRAVAAASPYAVPAPPPPPAPAVPAVPKVAPPAPPAPPKPPGHAGTHVINIDREGSGDAYVLIDGNEVTMAGRSDDIVTARKQQQGNAPVLWVRQDGQQYVVRDPDTLKRIKAAHAPMEALGAQQGKLGEAQGALGERQGGCRRACRTAEGKAARLPRQPGRRAACRPGCSPGRPVRPSVRWHGAAAAHRAPGSDTGRLTASIPPAPAPADRRGRRCDRKSALHPPARSPRAGRARRTGSGIG